MNGAPKSCLLHRETSRTDIKSPGGCREIVKSDNSRLRKPFGLLEEARHPSPVKAPPLINPARPFSFSLCCFPATLWDCQYFSGPIHASPSFPRPAGADDRLLHQGAVLAAAVGCRAGAAVGLCAGPARQGLVAAVFGADADAERF